MSPWQGSDQSAQKDRPSTFRVGLNPSSSGFRHSARVAQIQTFGLERQFDIFPSISRLFLRWRRAKFHSQTGWGSMAGISFWIRYCMDPSSSVNVVLFSTYSLRLPETTLLYTVSFCLFDVQNYLELDKPIAGFFSPHVFS